MKPLVLIVLLTISVSSFAGEQIEKTLDVKANGVIEIHNVRGEVTVSGWPKNQVKISGTLDELTEEFIFTSQGGLTIIKVKLPKNSRNSGREGSRLNVMVPQSSQINFTGVATDLNVNNIDGGVEINSVSGDIEVTQTKLRTYVNSVSGKLSLTDIEGSMQISTVSGHLKARVNCQKVGVTAVSANVEVALGKIESAILSTVSGDALISGQLNKGGEIKLNSVSGDAYYLVEGPLNATVTIETASGGSIVNDFSDDKPHKNFINSQSVNLTSGEGNAVIRMSTVSGSIGLKKVSE